jgi:polyisoprenoid-binding protein YceI
MSKVGGARLLFLTLCGWLLTGCSIAMPLIQDTRAADSPPMLVRTTKLYRLLPKESKALFVAREHYLKQEPELDNVMGVSTTLTGTIELDPQQPAAVRMSPIHVDLFALDMQNDELEEVLRYIYLQSDRFPLASFTPLRYAGLPEICTGNEELTFTITGHLSIRDITQEITFSVTARIENERLVGKATTRVPMTTFGVEPPNKVGISWVEDEVTIEVKFVAAPDA